MPYTLFHLLGPINKFISKVIYIALILIVTQYILGEFKRETTAVTLNENQKRVEIIRV